MGVGGVTSISTTERWLGGSYHLSPLGGWSGVEGYLDLLCGREVWLGGVEDDRVAEAGTP